MKRGKEDGVRDEEYGMGGQKMKDGIEGILKDGGDGIGL